MSLGAGFPESLKKESDENINLKSITKWKKKRHQRNRSYITT